MGYHAKLLVHNVWRFLTEETGISLRKQFFAQELLGSCLTESLCKGQLFRSVFGSVGRYYCFKAFWQEAFATLSSRKLITPYCRQSYLQKAFSVRKHVLKIVQMGEASTLCVVCIHDWHVFETRVCIPQLCFIRLLVFIFWLQFKPKQHSRHV